MMSVAAFFASGTAFFSGGACLLAGLILATRWRQRFAKAAGRLLITLGIFQIVILVTPLPLWAYSIWASSLLAWIVIRCSRFASRPRWRTAALATCIGCSVAAVVWELSYQLSPPALTGHWPRLVVIGDSLSAAEFTEGGDPWPTLLARDHAVAVDNLAFNGAQAASAEKKVSSEQVAHALVLLEIGGNDLLGATSSDDFDRHLERLLKKVCRPDNAVVMLELPLPPLYNRLGEIQRRLAGAYHVYLIPKREFARVIAGKNATVDSLHLSPAGHRAMAEMIWKHLSSVLHHDP
jgi:acyl-CoA thioesterase-1